MANLLPQQARKQVTLEYWSRVMVVWMFLLAAAGMAVLTLMTPTLLLINAQKEALASQVASMQAKQEVFDAAADEVTNANTEARHIDQHDGYQSVLDLIDRIDELSGSDVMVTQFSFRQDTEVVEPLVIQGIATDRTTLAAFRDALSADQHFQQVELPIASLAADRNVPFTMTITVAKQ